ncbi:hypothetical protein SD77_2461 [Bacillus badius]|uniref:Uncharacterized protein n=1 Tax=Bacillus badius TaxID=1455 RepID=A0ABR5AZ60_BACBA|nr:hypothetical protein SD77_2461 [Bacillus badius]
MLSHCYSPSTSKLNFSSIHAAGAPDKNCSYFHYNRKRLQSEGVIPINFSTNFVPYLLL